MKLKIKAVDHDGFNGREHPPTDDMVGSLVTPVQMTTQYFDQETGDFYTLDYVISNPDPRFQDMAIRIWTAMFDDGTVVELVEHEVDILLPVIVRGYNDGK